MGIFGSKTIVWIPDNEKLLDKCEHAAQWDARESFVGWKVCNDGKHLAKAMGEADSCGNFDFSYNGLGDDEAAIFARVIANHFRSKHATDTPGSTSGKMTKLSFANNHFHAKGVKALCDALTPENPRIGYSLEELDLSNNAAGPEGAAAIAQLITVNRVLRRVNLAWNNIGNQGFVSLAQAMQSHHRSFRLDISNNTFDTSIPLDNDQEWEDVVKSLKRSLGGPEGIRAVSAGHLLPNSNPAPRNQTQVWIGWDETALKEFLN